MCKLFQLPGFNGVFVGLSLLGVTCNSYDLI